MAQILQHRRATTQQLGGETGMPGEFWMDETKNTLVVMDGTTVGGHPLAKESDIPIKVSDLPNDAGYITSSSVFSGSYNDLTNKPSLFSGAYADLTGKPSLFSGAYADLTGKPSLFSGAYADLAGKPDLSVYQLSASAFDGDYNSLTNIPTIPNDVSELTDTTNILDHFSGSYNDLTDKPNLTVYQLTVDAFNGNYAELFNTPTIPNVVSDLPNDANYITINDVSSYVGSQLTGYSTINDVTSYVNFQLTNYISISQLKSIASSSADYNAFRSAILGL